MISESNFKSTRSTTWTSLPELPTIKSTIYELFERYIKNPLSILIAEGVLIIALSIAFTVISITNPAGIPLIILGVAISLGIITTSLTFYHFRQELKYHCSLIYTLFNHAVKPELNAWWSSVDDQIIIGAIPLNNHGHIKKIIEDEKVTAVLTLLEPFEINSKGWFSSPVKPAEWNHNGISHKHIHALDFLPLTQQQIIDGVTFLKEQIKNNKKIYVHCKAGRGRSVTVVVCYLLQRDLDSYSTFEDVMKFIKEKRPSMNLNSAQQNAIAVYFSRLKNHSTTV